ncbi:Serpin B11 [Thelohanellus kitauei]|uniref:Serpin B11 n=1 Tax=Thelohanellus kitauei TaxID=669202 RepID=A0A0C2M5G3_THEKT|nr:Serpin B11 [Thelohanellus kitauei]
MSAEVVNRFTFDVLNQLYLSQNSTENIAFCGTVLYLMMGVIGIGLRGRSYEKLSNFLHQDVDEFIDNESWVKSENAKMWSKLRRKSYIEKISRISIFYSGQLSAYYYKISRRIFMLKHTQINHSNPEESADEINRWITWTVFDDNIWKVVKKSMVSENEILFISTIFFNLKWKDKFYKYRRDRWFFGDNDEALIVEMMYQPGIYNIYIQPIINFRIIYIHLNNDDLLLSIVVPGDTCSTDEMLKSFKIEQMSTYINQSKVENVTLLLPKFQIAVSYDFVSALMTIGMTDLFYRNDSDFGRMTNHSVVMKNLFQVTSVSVDEFGINSGEHEWYHGESSVDDNISLFIPNRHRRKFRIDRPFLFLIYSIEHNLVHFSALVKKPTVN